MQGDNLTIVLFLGGSGIALVIAAVAQAGWKHKLLIGGLLAVGAIFCLSAVFWWLLKDISPSFTGFIKAVAVNPASWFFVLLMMTCAAWIRRRSSPDKFANERISSLEGIVDQLTKRELASDAVGDKNKLTALIEAVQQLLMGRIENVERSIAVQTTEAHMVLEQIKPINIDLHHLLSFALHDATLRLLDNLKADAPMSGYRRDVTEYNGPQAMEVQRAQMDGYARRVHAQFAGNFRASDIAEIFRTAEYDATQTLRHTPQSDRPDGIDPLDLQSYMIAEMKCLRLTTYLFQQRQELNARMIQQRAEITERLLARSPAN